jgi:hypothetical protein
VAVVVAVVGVAAGLAIDSKESAASRTAAPHAVATEQRPLAGDVRARDLAPATPPELPPAGAAAAATAATAATTATPRGTHGTARPPASHATSEEPGKKPPRPNPYPSSSPPR